VKRHTPKNKTYNTLSQFMNEILDIGIEKVVEFNGYELKTNRASYGLCDGELRITENASHNIKPKRNTRTRTV